jgi:hypothetical protein
VRTPEVASALVPCNDVRMSDAARIKAELWRLGFLLSGSEAGADRALRRVLEVNPDVRKLAAERRLRIAISGAREAPAAISSDGGVARVRDVLSGMELLPRVCWVLRDVEGMSDVETSRAVGVTKAAADQYADQAREKVAAALEGRVGEAIDALRRSAQGLSVDVGMARVDVELAARRGRRRLTTALGLLTLAVAMGLIAFVGRSLIQSEREERAELQMLERVPESATPEERARLEEMRRQREGPAAGETLPRRTP